MTDIVNKNHTDIKQLTWVKKLPPQIQPYIYLMRLDRPIGVWLLLLPGLWSIALAITSAPQLDFNAPRPALAFVYFTIGAVLMRAAGCIANDLWDKDLDKHVERTKNRPIASGAISTKNATIFMGILLLLSLIILLQFNKLTVVLGLATLPLIALYPLMKRITWWPQLFLGLTFNFSALIGYSAMSGELHLPALLLYAAGIFWTIGYDTVYAQQDVEDDAIIGIKSTARLFGEKTKTYVSLFYALSILLLCASTFLSKGPIVALPLCSLPLLHFYWQMKNWDTKNPQSALDIFKSNTIAGLLVLLVCIAP